MAHEALVLAQPRAPHFEGAEGEDAAQLRRGHRLQDGEQLGQVLVHGGIALRNGTRQAYLNRHDVLSEGEGKRGRVEGEEPGKELIHTKITQQKLRQKSRRRSAYLRADGKSKKRIGGKL